MSEQGGDLARLARRVRQLACLSGSLQTCVGLCMTIPFVLAGAVIPKGVSYDDFRHKCDEGSLPKDSCRQLKQFFDGICSEQRLQEKDCAEWLNHVSAGLKDALFLIAAVIMFCTCLGNCVPLCGYYGAKLNSKFLVSCFMVFNLLSVLLFVPQLAQDGVQDGWHPWIAVPLFFSFVLPLLSFSYALMLRKQQAVPNALTVPLLQPPAMTEAPAQPPGEEGKVQQVGPPCYAPAAPEPETEPAQPVQPVRPMQYYEQGPYQQPVQPVYRGQPQSFYPPIQALGELPSAPPGNGDGAAY